MRIAPGTSPIPFQCPGKLRRNGRRIAAGVSVCGRKCRLWGGAPFEGGVAEKASLDACLSEKADESRSFAAAFCGGIGFERRSRSSCIDPLVPEYQASKIEAALAMLTRRSAKFSRWGVWSRRLRARKIAGLRPAGRACAHRSQYPHGNRRRPVVTPISNS